jgi:RNase adaptor protein for sRNA GlmZ degradation
MQILRDGNKITLVDIGCEGEYTRSVTLADVHERVALTPASHLLDMINENDDACTADVVIQSVFFEDIIFG